MTKRLRLQLVRHVAESKQPLAPPSDVSPMKTTRLTKDEPTVLIVDGEPVLELELRRNGLALVDAYTGRRLAWVPIEHKAIERVTT